jgi:DNA-nicking Smr family endonuclease
MEFKPPSRKRALTAEEAELWAHVMRDAKALKRRQRAAGRAVREDVPVPQWLAEPEFRTIVLSYTAASIRHGGEGALYVRLRRLGHGV